MQGYACLLPLLAAVLSMDALAYLSTLVDIFGRGANASQIQRVSAAVAKSTVCPEEVYELAELGTPDPRNPDYRINVERDLERWTWRQPWRRVFPKAYTVETWGKRKRGMGINRMKINLILPHDVIGIIYALNQALFQRLFDYFKDFSDT